MALCVECEEEYPDARRDNMELDRARYYCTLCAMDLMSMHDIRADNAKRMVLAHKDGYKLVRTRDDVRAISTGKPTGGTTTTAR